MSPIHIVTILLIGISFGFAVLPSAKNQGDITPPELIDLVIEPAIIDTKASSQTITMTAHFVDDLSGYGDAFILFKPSIGTTLLIEFPFRKESLIRGDLKNGYYQSSAILPQYAAQGSWIIQQLSVVDAVGNRIDLVEGGTTDPLPERYYQYKFLNGEEQPTPTPLPTSTPTATLTPTVEPTPRPTVELGQGGISQYPHSIYIPSISQ